MALELVAKNESENRQKEEKNKDYKNIIKINYFTFAEQFLEKPILPKTDMLGEYACIPHPTFCTWKGVPTIDDADLLD